VPRTALLELDDVSVWTPQGAVLLTDISWTVRPGETWALLGPNGAGKSTLLAVASTTRHPSRGQARILGRQLGRVDVWTLKSKIGVVDQQLRMPPDLSVEDVVLTGKTGSVELMRTGYTTADRARAAELLELMGCSHLRGRNARHLSQGERGRVRIARALMAEPHVLLLDEPATGLDLLAREELLLALEDLQNEVAELAVVLVSHHVEELPAHTSHALLLRSGRVVSGGPVDDALTSRTLSACFAGPVELTRTAQRWSARLQTR
jgi:iron complex transport system ATP-binding protein